MIYKPRHFRIEELVCPHAHDVYKESLLWAFFDERLLMTIDFIRDQLGPVTVNDWHVRQGGFTQRGLRCIRCAIVKKAIKEGRMYFSAHMRGQAVDFNVRGVDPATVQLFVLQHYQIFPFPIRLEKNTRTWTHLDVCNTGTNKVELFI